MSWMDYIDSQYNDQQQGQQQSAPVQQPAPAPTQGFGSWMDTIDQNYYNNQDYYQGNGPDSYQAAQAAVDQSNQQAQNYLAQQQAAQEQQAIQMYQQQWQQDQQMWPQYFSQLSQQQQAQNNPYNAIQNAVGATSQEADKTNFDWNPLDWFGNGGGINNALQGGMNWFGENIGSWLGKATDAAADSNIPGLSQLGQGVRWGYENIAEPTMNFVPSLVGDITHGNLNTLSNLGRNFFDSDYQNQMRQKKTQVMQQAADYAASQGYSQDDINKMLQGMDRHLNNFNMAEYGGLQSFSDLPAVAQLATMFLDPIGNKMGGAVFGGKIPLGKGFRYGLEDAGKAGEVAGELRNPTLARIENAAGYATPMGLIEKGTGAIGNIPAVQAATGKVNDFLKSNMQKDTALTRAQDDFINHVNIETQARLDEAKNSGTVMPTPEQVKYDVIKDFVNKDPNQLFNGKFAEVHGEDNAATVLDSYREGLQQAQENQAFRPGIENSPELSEVQSKQGLKMQDTGTLPSEDQWFSNKPIEHQPTRELDTTPDVSPQGSNVDALADRYATAAKWGASDNALKTGDKTVDAQAVYDQVKNSITDQESLNKFEQENPDIVSAAKKRYGQQVAEARGLDAESAFKPATDNLDQARQAKETQASQLNDRDMKGIAKQFGGLTQGMNPKLEARLSTMTKLDDRNGVQLYHDEKSGRMFVVSGGMYKPTSVASVARRAFNKIADEVERRTTPTPEHGSWEAITSASKIWQQQKNDRVISDYHDYVVQNAPKWIERGTEGGFKEVNERYLKANYDEEFGREVTQLDKMARTLLHLQAGTKEMLGNGKIVRRGEFGNSLAGRIVAGPGWLTKGLAKLWLNGPGRLVRDPLTNFIKVRMEGYALKQIALHNADMREAFAQTGMKTHDMESGVAKTTVNSKKAGITYDTVIGIMNPITEGLINMPLRWLGRKGVELKTPFGPIKMGDINTMVNELEGNVKQQLSMKVALDIYKNRLDEVGPDRIKQVADRYANEMETRLKQMGFGSNAMSVDDATVQRLIQYVRDPKFSSELMDLVKSKMPGPELADKLAAQYNFRNVPELSNLRDNLPQTYVDIAAHFDEPALRKYAENLGLDPESIDYNRVRAPKENAKVLTPEEQVFNEAMKQAQLAATTKAIEGLQREELEVTVSNADWLRQALIEKKGAMQKLDLGGVEAPSFLQQMLEREQQRYEGAYNTQFTRPGVQGRFNSLYSKKGEERQVNMKTLQTYLNGDLRYPPKGMPSFDQIRRGIASNGWIWDKHGTLKGSYADLYNLDGLRKGFENWDTKNVAGRQRLLDQFHEMDRITRFVSGNSYRLDPETFHPVHIETGKFLTDRIAEQSGIAKGGPKPKAAAPAKPEPTPQVTYKAIADRAKELFAQGKSYNEVRKALMQEYKIHNLAEVRVGVDETGKMSMDVARASKYLTQHVMGPEGIPRPGKAKKFAAWKEKYEAEKSAAPEPKPEEAPAEQPTETPAPQKPAFPSSVTPVKVGNKYDALSSDIRDRAGKVFDEHFKDKASLDEVFNQVDAALGDMAKVPFSQQPPEVQELARARVFKEMKWPDPTEPRVYSDMMKGDALQAKDALQGLLDGSRKSWSSAILQGKKLTGFEDLMDQHTSNMLSELRDITAGARIEAQAGGLKEADRILFDYTNKNKLDIALSNWLPFNYWARRNFGYIMKYFVDHPYKLAAMLHFYDQLQEENQKQGLPPWAWGQLVLAKNSDGTYLTWDFSKIMPTSFGDASTPISLVSPSADDDYVNNPAGNGLGASLFGVDVKNKKGQSTRRETGILGTIFRPSPLIDIPLKMGLLSNLLKGSGLTNDFFGSNGISTKQTIGISQDAKLLQDITSATGLVKPLRQSGAIKGELNVENPIDNFLFGNKTAGYNTTAITQELAMMVRDKSISQEQGEKALSALKRGDVTPELLQAIDRTNSADLGRKLLSYAGFSTMVYNTPGQQMNNQERKDAAATNYDSGQYVMQDGRKVWKPGKYSDFLDQHPEYSLLSDSSKSSQQIDQQVADQQVQSQLDRLYSQRQAGKLDNQQFNLAMAKLQGQNPDYFNRQQAKKLLLAYNGDTDLEGAKQRIAQEHPELDQGVLDAVKNYAYAPTPTKGSTRPTLDEALNPDKQARLSDLYDQFQKIGGAEYDTMTKTAQDLINSGNTQAGYAILNSKAYQKDRIARQQFLNDNPDFADYYKQLVEKKGGHLTSEQEQDLKAQQAEFYAIGGQKYDDLTNEANSLFNSGNSSAAYAILNSKEYQKVKTARQQYLDDHPDFAEFYKNSVEAKGGHLKSEAEQDYSQQKAEYYSIGGNKYDEMVALQKQLRDQGNTKAANAIYTSKAYQQAKAARQQYLDDHPDFAAQLKQEQDAKYGVGTGNSTSSTQVSGNSGFSGSSGRGGGSSNSSSQGYTAGRGVSGSSTSYFKSTGSRTSSGSSSTRKSGGGAVQSGGGKAQVKATPSSIQKYLSTKARPVAPKAGGTPSFGNYVNGNTGSNPETLPKSVTDYLSTPYQPKGRGGRGGGRSKAPRAPKAPKVTLAPPKLKRVNGKVRY